MSLAAIDTAIADIKDTDSGLIEFQNNSLATALQAIRDELALRIFPVDDVTALQEVDPDEATRVHVAGQGIFIHSEDAYDADIPNSYPAEGGGSWLRDNAESIATLKDVELDTVVNANGLTYNSADSKWNNAVPSIANLHYDNVTSKPAQLTGLAATDLLLKLFNATNKSIGTAESGLGNIRLLPQGTDMTGGTASTVITNAKIGYMTSAVDSVIVTNMTELRPGTTPFTVARCIIIGDVGDLSAYFNVNVLEDLVIIGSDGAPTFVKKANGEVFISGGSGGSPVTSFSDPAVFAQGATVTTTLAVTGATTLSSYIKLASWLNAGRPATPAAGMMGYNTTANKIEYYNGTTWVQLP